MSVYDRMPDWLVNAWFSALGVAVTGVVLFVGVGAAYLAFLTFKMMTGAAGDVCPCGCDCVSECPV